MNIELHYDLARDIIIYMHKEVFRPHNNEQEAVSRRVHEHRFAS
jgi:hypothetical protein